MLSLSPAKLLVILVVALIVLGPEKLPQVARQIGAAWRDLRRLRTRLESEVRGAFPDLPPTHEVAQAVRSPLAFLDRLADEHERALSDEPGAPAEPVVDGGTDAGAGPRRHRGRRGLRRRLDHGAGQRGGSTTARSRRNGVGVGHAAGRRERRRHAGASVPSRRARRPEHELIGDATAPPWPPDSDSVPRRGRRDPRPTP